MVNEVRLLVGSGQILVNPRCKMLIGSLKYGIWDNKRKEFAENKVYGHFDHLAWLIYMVRNLNKTTNPIPASHGFENHRAWLHHVKHKAQSHNSREIGRLLTAKPAEINTSLRKRGLK